MTNPDSNPTVKTSITTVVKEPHLYKLIYVNDDKTAMEFVIETLVDIFHYTPTTAENITLDIHEKGSAVVAVLPYEMAEQKGVEVTMSARSKGYPLQVKLEPDA
jgi:ATP-dependent Clp protease adaptor protein ClpS|tara:strand:- start:369 stop:680 length:312 start_codon:yes stop_codon:yes gene_type:complete